jgi:hypothetical protein
MGVGTATFRWTVELVFAIALARYFNLPPRKRFFTQDAQAPVVQRTPIPELILVTQD